ncbi:hypothetical protein DY000_02009696 [Brassica cretica]|uniref:Uncharacterized protein n=1 Tax=Brassica cretica TaxID=69181 RepID=A0ABQ7CF35_BRACR|nr:hypothetical protein DY000_02009696 [Brassica cretica]
MYPRRRRLLSPKTQVTPLEADALIHMYDLQTETGNWVSGYQAASGSLHYVVEYSPAFDGIYWKEDPTSEI